ncbi:DUF2470 domain-containing protein [Mycobacterium simiae]|uniref:DUF2470 domain-containing protein n=1 Tax=Mycobacterium simiae TaxID=1784 RepID=A0A5B1BSD0_MYCSI|nr:DUF2470 domain-containing protein [Mycobacterium simiae]KAA1250243.1 DUF2470 domain-containing protein [Mycobacterium simiae]
MLSTTSPIPTTAERIRSACARAGGALLAVERDEPLVTPLHHLMHDGSFAVALPADQAGRVGAASYGAGAGSQALLELTDYAPLPVREPVRSLVWARGRLHCVAPELVTTLLDGIAAENPQPALLQVQTPRSGPFDGTETRYTLLRLQIESVVVTDAFGAEPVAVADLLAARPDPFCEIESSLLWHLTTTHDDVIARLVSRLPAQLRRGQVRPLGLDRYGVRFRVEDSDGDRDVRLPFRKPVDDMTALGQAIRVLMGCPFVNGLHARPHRTP